MVKKTRIKRLADTMHNLVGIRFQALDRSGLSSKSAINISPGISEHHCDYQVTTWLQTPRYKIHRGGKALIYILPPPRELHDQSLSKSPWCSKYQLFIFLSAPKIKIPTRLYKLLITHHSLPPIHNFTFPFSILTFWNYQ